jgi:hypothetical protein
MLNMLRRLVVRLALAGSAALVPIAGVTVLAANPAQAVPSGITCSKVSGSINTSTGLAKIKPSVCNGNTGGSGKSKGMFSSLAATYKWINGKSTTISVTWSSGFDATCPHPKDPDIEIMSAKATADNTGSTSVGAAVTATLCLTPTAKGDSVSVAPGTVGMRFSS